MSKETRAAASKTNAVDTNTAESALLVINVVRVGRFGFGGVPEPLSKISITHGIKELEEHSTPRSP